MAQVNRPERCGSLPNDFISIQDFLDGKRRVGTFVNLIGVVVDFRSPIPTRGADYKCQLRLYDHTSNDTNEDSVEVNIFWQKEEMPDVSLRDVVIIYQAKVQRLSAQSLSLITNRTTDIYVYSASKIPKPPSDAHAALKPLRKKAGRKPTEREVKYVSTLYHSIDKSMGPTETEFEAMKIKSANVTKKFRELKDIQEGIFVDMIVQIVKQPYDHGDRCTIWVSDYTENVQFFHHKMKGLDGSEGDPYGYLVNNYTGTEASSDWNGPYGKQSLQVTCWEPHSSLIRDRNLTSGSWVLLRNVQIKYGHNASNLEGYMREDRMAAGVKINVIPLDITEDRDTIDPRLKEALRRKRSYEREKKAQLKAISEAAKAGQKRKSAMPAQENTRSRRKARRAAGARIETEESKQPQTSNLNSQIKCENMNQTLSSIEEILERAQIITAINGEGVKIELPFTNAKYRADVRVVNFMPAKLEDFSHPKRRTEFEALSDNEDDSSESDWDPDVDMGTMNPDCGWEWRFMLELEDASEGEAAQRKKPTVWVAVGNQAAQCLVNLDASNLRRDQENFDMLRQRMFLLWGDLEEQKRTQEEEKAKKKKTPHGPPSDSSDDEGGPATSQADSKQIKNRPFPCCIQQYGAKVREDDPKKADAGEGRRWQRMFGLFGTRIQS